MERSELDRRLTALAGEDEWTRQRVLEELRSEALPAIALRELGERLHDEDATSRSSARMALAAIASPGSASHPAAQAELRRALRSDLESARVMAASALGESGDPDAGPPLLEALSDPSPNVVAAVADALGEIGYAPALDALGATSRTDDLWLRAAAIIAMGRLQDERAMVYLEELAREPGLEKPLIEALIKIDHPTALPVLERVYQTAPDEALRAAGHLLATHPKVEAPEWVLSAAREDEEALRLAMVRDDDPAIGRLVGLAGSPEAVKCLVDLIGPPRRSEAAITGLLAAPGGARAAAILTRLPTADDQELVNLLSLLPPLSDPGRVQQLVPLLEHSAESVRGAAAEALARARSEEALSLLAAEAARDDVTPEVVRAIGSLGEVACSSLLPLLHDPSASVRAAAAGALARCATADTEDKLRAALSREEVPETRDALLRSLARSVGRNALPELDRALDAERLDSRLAAIEGLGFTRDDAAIPRLTRALERSPAETLAAIRALGQLRLSSALPVLEPYLHHEDLDLRRAAVWEVVPLTDALEPDVVERIATDEDGWIRTCAARVLARQGERGRSRLQTMADRDPDPAVRAAARRGLGRTG